MTKNKKKVIYSLIATTLLSTSVASAAPYNYRNIDYNSSYNNYKTENTISYNNNYYNNYWNNNNNNNNNVVAKPEAITNDYPVFTWEVVLNTSPITRPGYVIDLPIVPIKPVQPSYPAPSLPEKPLQPETPAPIEPSTPSVSGLSAIELEVVRLVNIERQKGGLQPFVASTELSNVARIKSEDMVANNYFSHTSPTYGSPFTMMKTFGIKYNTAGENIARGQLSAQSVVNGWMNSSGHRDNIMNPSFKKIGVGHSKSGNGTNYWTQMFTN